MFIIQLTYKAPIQEVDKYLQAHSEFLDYHYKQRLFLVSGPQIPRTGGIIVATTNDKSHLESVLKEDPYYLAEVADHEVIEFSPVKQREEFKAIIQNTEGKIC